MGRTRGSVASTIFWCVLTILFLSAGRLDALDPALKATQYAHTAWMRDNVALASRVEAVAQTSDGSLWLGTEAGLYRFDGIESRPWKSPAGRHLISESILALAPGRDGGLWIGTKEGLAYWKGGTLENYPIPDRTGNPRVISVLVDHAGNVWAGLAGYRTGGLCRVENHALRCDSDAGHLPGRGVLSLFEDRGGNIWAGGLGVCRWSGQMPSTCMWEETAAAVYAIAENPAGGIWAGGQGLKDPAGSRSQDYLVPGFDPKLHIKALLTDRDGGLWIGTLGQGLLHYWHGRVDRFTETEGLSNDTVLSLIEDKEGNIWAGTDGGLDRFREYRVTRISRREGIASSNVTSVFPSRDGGMWVGTTNGLNHLVDGKSRTFDQKDGLPGDDVLGIFEESNGRVWVFTGRGLAYLSQGRFHSVQLPGNKKIWFRSAAETPDHTLWLSDQEHGLIRLNNAQITQVVAWSTFGGQAAAALEADPVHGGIWLGFDQGKVAWYRPDTGVRWYSTPHPPGAGRIRDLHRNADGSLWMATDSGLVHFAENGVVTLSKANGLPCDGLRGLVEDDDGGLWVATDCGLVSIQAGELQNWNADRHARIRVRTFEASDGMRQHVPSALNFRRAAKSADGRIWLADSDAVAVTNPRRLQVNAIPPTVKIDEIAGDQSTYPTTAAVRLAPLTRDVRIRYTAMSFVIPEKVRFRYRLDGFDTDWKDDAGHRQAVYTNLSPGRYHFRVIASNNDGFWNNIGAGYDFSVAPAYYQTAAFQITCVLGALALIWMAHRMRLRHLSRQYSLESQTRLEERLRISREMHDSLLQKILGISLQIGGLSKTKTIPEDSRERLAELRRETEDCARETREFVCELRAPTLVEVNLSEALREAGEEITQGLPVNFRMTVQGTPRPAPPQLLQDLLRIVQEAARNSVRYSQAKEIAMDITYLDSDRIRLQMDDDGCGFDVNEAMRKVDHWGLKTMQERARKIGGKLTIRSEPGHGTRIEIEVPVGSPA